ncbi:hypothetical protein [Butyrivibrio sp. AE2032]|uniref:hypothetical protein n=1 Tax=Butyrivibrio sp. AE2032 TaxID=1458463 RepID=UPI000B128141|nr:hypothetical protein [Butyrivibrio sp. AE2032]
MDKKITPQMIEKLKSAKSASEISRIIGLGDADVQQLNLGDLDGVSGGGHYIKDDLGQEIWIELSDKDYELGTDPFYDKAYLLEQMALAGFSMDILIDVANNLYMGKYKSRDVDTALRAGGPVYLADCVRGAHGFHFFGEG